MQSKMKYQNAISPHFSWLRQKRYHGDSSMSATLQVTNLEDSRRQPSASLYLVMPPARFQGTRLICTNKWVHWSEVDCCQVCRATSSFAGCRAMDIVASGGSDGALQGSDSGIFEVDGSRKRICSPQVKVFNASLVSGIVSMEM